MKLTIATLIAASPLLVGSIHASSADLFSWLDSGRNTQIVREVEKAFSEEIRPDIPDKVKPYVPILYKYLAHIGVYKTSCLVIIGYRERADTPKEYDAFEAFSFDLDTKKRKESSRKIITISGLSLSSHPLNLLQHRTSFLAISIVWNVRRSNSCPRSGSIQKKRDGRREYGRKMIRA